MSDTDWRDLSAGSGGGAGLAPPMRVIIGGADLYAQSFDESLGLMLGGAGAARLGGAEADALDSGWTLVRPDGVPPGPGPEPEPPAEAHGAAEQPELSLFESSVVVVDGDDSSDVEPSDDGPSDDEPSDASSSDSESSDGDDSSDDDDEPSGDSRSESASIFDLAVVPLPVPAPAAQTAPAETSLLSAVVPVATTTGGDAFSNEPLDEPEHDSGIGGAVDYRVDHPAAGPAGGPAAGPAPEGCGCR